MKSRVTHTLPLLLMVLLGGLTLWLKQSIEGPPPPSSGHERHDADATVEKFTLTRLGPDGLPETQLSAQRMVHFGDDDSTELHSPQLLKNDAGSTLSVLADRGVVTRDYEDARFYDNVLLLRKGQSTRDELQIRTQYLQALIKQDVLRTDQPVTISQGSSVLSGVGMEYDRKTGHLTLLSDVKARFDAKRR
jgi:lipopolysaccharide export system protein LptC